MGCPFALLKVVFILDLDEYILPKIAERYLRRFANLRSTTSALGVHVPINEVSLCCLLVLLTLPSSIFVVLEE